jgi:hypothetical protein
MLISKILHVRHTSLYINWKKGRILPFMMIMQAIGESLVTPSMCKKIVQYTCCKYIVHKITFGWSAGWHRSRASRRADP